MTFKPKYLFYNFTKFNKQLKPFTDYAEQQKKEYLSPKIDNEGLSWQNLEESDLQLLGIEVVHIFYRYIFSGEALTERELYLLHTLDELKINKNWHFYTKILVLQSKSIKAIYERNFEEIRSFQEKILSIWKENTDAITVHNELFVEFAFLYVYQYVMVSSVNKEKYNSYDDLLSLLKYVNLSKAKSALMERYKSLHLLMEDTESLINNNIIKPDIINRNTTFKVLSQKKENTIFFFYYLRAATAFYQDKKQLAKVYTDFVSKQIVNGQIQVRGYSIAILLMKLCLNSDAQNEQKTQILLMDLRIVLKDDISHPYYKAFCSLMIELNQSNADNRNSILLAAYQEFNGLEKKYAVFKKNLGAFDILRWIELELKG